MQRNGRAHRNIRNQNIRALNRVNRNEFARLQLVQARNNQV